MLHELRAGGTEVKLWRSFGIFRLVREAGCSNLGRNGSLVDRSGAGHYYGELKPDWTMSLVDSAGSGEEKLVCVIGIDVDWRNFPRNIDVHHAIGEA